MTAMEFGIDDIPDLTCSRPVSVEIDGRALERAYLDWYTLALRLMIVAAERLPTETVSKLLHQWEQHYAPKEGVKAHDANKFWKACYHFIILGQLNIKVMWLWEDNATASHPGCTAFVRRPDH